MDRSSSAYYLLQLINVTFESKILKYKIPCKRDLYKLGYQRSSKFCI